MDEPSYYGFPCYGEPTVKAAQDCGGPVVDPDRRTSEPDPEMLRPAGRVHGLAAAGLGSGRCGRCAASTRSPPTATSCSRRCPATRRSSSGSGSAHGFKFAPTFGRILADLVTTGETSSDVSAFGFDRPGLTDPAYEANWMV